MSLFEVEVVLPDKGARASRSSWGGRKPQAKVQLRFDDGGEEVLYVPLTVGKSLRRRLKEEVAPSSRNELVYRLRELQEQVAVRRVADLLNRRDYSSKELSDKLRMDGYWTDVVHSCLRKAQEGNLVNDRRYADIFIRSKINAGWGATRIARTLSQRGIDVDELEGWPEAYLPQEDEAQRAYELASRRHYRGRDPYAQAVRFLGTRGFSMHIAHAVASRLRDEGLLGE